ncbi:MAG: lipoate--protein ligase family protein, partial [Candidatus Eiseniibacteriota bacterium]
MILWCDGTHDAAENMRRDAVLLGAAERGAEPVLRVFGFSPPGITLGRNQTPARELDLARCAAAGVVWAVRPTGGRAILHAEEWTYGLAAPVDDPLWGGGASATYARASTLVLRALVRLGVPAEFA